MDLLALSDFNLVATHGGFGKASRASGLAKATLSRRVRDLEESLGVRLIERGSRSLRLTDEGAILHARTEAPFGEIAEATKDVRSGLGRPSGRLRVSVPMLFAQTVMGRLGAAFIKAYPEVQLDVTAEDRFTNLIEDGYDIVVRINPRRDEDLVGRRFLKAGFVLVAATSMQRPARAKSAGLVPLVAAVMRTGEPDDVIWTVMDGKKELRIRPKAVLRFSSPLMMRDAVLAGAGVALVPRSVVEDDLAEGRLVAWGTANEGEIEGWVLHASRRLISPKVSAFVNFLCEYYVDERATVDGGKQRG